MTLETYSYKQSRGSGAGLLAVELSLTEVRAVKTQVTTSVITKPKNFTSADGIHTGKTQGAESAAAAWFGGKTSSQVNAGKK